MRFNHKCWLRSEQNDISDVYNVVWLKTLVCWGINLKSTIFLVFSHGFTLKERISQFLNHHKSGIKLVNTRWCASCRTFYCQCWKILGNYINLNPCTDGFKSKYGYVLIDYRVSGQKHHTWSYFTPQWCPETNVYKYTSHTMFRSTEFLTLSSYQFRHLDSLCFITTIDVWCCFFCLEINFLQWTLMILPFIFFQFCDYPVLSSLSHPYIIFTSYIFHDYS